MYRVRNVFSKVSVVVITHNEGLNLRLTVENLQDTLPARHEIVVVDDRSSDGSTDFLAQSPAWLKLIRPKRRLGVAGARNYGANRTDGDVIVFCDAHLGFPGGWCGPLLSLLEDPLIGAAAPCISDRGARHNKGFGLKPSGPDLNADWLGRKGNDPYPVPLLPGACMAMRRDVFRAAGGFDRKLIRYGVEDCELSLRLWLLGYELWLVPAVDVEHEFHDRIPYDVDWRTVLHNRLRMAFMHFSNFRRQRVLDALQEYPDFAPALALVNNSDAALRRSELELRRKRDDDWFFQRFRLSW
ncbi:MAG TPA: glycosyltransferase [Bryobacteraceae bacterium]|jgi:GT2 family glycosyltransferase